jgi:hypothetical protein
MLLTGIILVGKILMEIKNSPKGKNDMPRLYQHGSTLPKLFSMEVEIM